MNSSRTSRIPLNWISFWAYSLFVFETAIISPQKIPRFIASINDKLLHGVEYYLLFWISLKAFLGFRNLSLQKKADLLALAYCFLMGVATEWAQRFAFGRSCDFWDWLADAGAASLALIIYRSLTAAGKKSKIKESHGLF